MAVDNSRADKGFDFTYDDTCATKGRHAYRASLPGLSVTINDAPTAYMVQNFSSSGVSFLAPGHDLPMETNVVLHMWIANYLCVRDLYAIVVRTSGVELACKFYGLNRRQEIRLDKLLIEAQKRQIALLKSLEEDDLVTMDDSDDFNTNITL